MRNNGTTAVEYSYDEWGRRRNPSDLNDYINIPNLGFIDRGYTGHEHYDQFNLINMLSEEGILSVGAKSREPYEAENGRVYDPVIGRFLSPDPVIQAPDFTQNYNSYSYCLNNPLKYTDPTGRSYSGNTGSFGSADHPSLQQMLANLYGNLAYLTLPSLEMIDETRREIMAEHQRAENQKDKKQKDKNQKDNNTKNTKKAQVGDISLPWPLIFCNNFSIPIVFSTTAVVSALPFILIPGDTRINKEKTYYEERGPVSDYGDPENKKQQNRYGNDPPPWFWPAICTAAGYEIIKNKPKPDLPPISVPEESTFSNHFPYYLYDHDR